MISSVGGLSISLKCMGGARAYCPHRHADELATIAPRYQRLGYGVAIGAGSALFQENLIVLGCRMRYKGKTIRSRRRRRLGYTFVAGRAHPSVTNIR